MKLVTERVKPAICEFESRHLNVNGGVVQRQHGASTRRQVKSLAASTPFYVF